MTQRPLRLANRLGLHARASARLVRLAERFDCTLALKLDGNLAQAALAVAPSNPMLAEHVARPSGFDAKKIMSVMMFGAALHLLGNPPFLVVADGPDEAAAVAALQVLVSERFGEGQ